MHERNSTISSGNTDRSSAKAWGIEGPWSLRQTLDDYELEELTAAQAAELVRETGHSCRSRRADH
jgi:hypothetical protein